MQQKLQNQFLNDTFVLLTGNSGDFTGASVVYEFYLAKIQYSDLGYKIHCIFSTSKQKCH